jgi:putative aminopeptidase FrvX
MIDERGYLRFHQIGRWWPQALAAQRVNVVNSRGEVLPAVIGSKPPHLMSDEEKNRGVKQEELFIDVGATSKEDAEKRLGIVPGDVILAESPFTEMAGGQRLISKAWDDRAGVATMIRVMDLLKSQKHPNTVIGCGTVQEEVGFRGAKTVAATVEPDVALILEVAITGDLPGMKPEEAQGELGKGPMLCIFDGGMIPSRPLRDFVAETAQKTGIAIQFTSLAGGFTDGAQIHSSGRGVPSLYLGVPCRYVHAHHSVIDAEDFENTVRLVTEVVLRLDEKAFAKIAGE